MSNSPHIYTNGKKLFYREALLMVVIISIIYSIRSIGNAEANFRAFMPQGMCYLWNAHLMLLHGLSDGVIFISYVVISISLFRVGYARKSRNLQSNVTLLFNPWMFLGFGTFIMACGLAHLMAVITLWVPLYWLAGAVKFVTAVASVATAVAVLFNMKRVLAIPNVSEIMSQLKNDSVIKHEIADRLDKLLHKNEQP